MAQGFDLRHLAICAGSSRVLFCLRSLLPLALLLLPPLALPLLPLLLLLSPLLLPLFLLLLVLGLEVGQEGWIWGQKNALAAPRGQTGGIRRMIVSALFIYQCYHQVFSVLLG